MLGRRIFGSMSRDQASEIARMNHAPEKDQTGEWNMRCLVWKDSAETGVISASVRRRALRRFGLSQVPFMVAGAHAQLPHLFILEFGKYRQKSDGRIQVVTREVFHDLLNER